MKRVLVYIDPDFVASSLDLTGVVEGMYGPNMAETTGFTIGSPPDSVMGTLDRLVHLETGPNTRFDLEYLSTCIAELHQAHRFQAIIFLSTTFGRMLAPRVAVRLKTGLVADVTGIRREGDEVRLIRPAFSGRMLATIAFRGEGPIMMSVRGQTFHRSASQSRRTKVSAFVPKATSRSRVRMKSRRPKASPYDIRESDVLVSGGGGIIREFSRLYDLAERIGGLVSASRKVVDRGKAPRAIQVGQSGKTVRPKVYLAIGISGSIQHITGLREAESIIAVNSDRYAPICSLADIVVEGDARVFLDEMMARLQRGDS